MLKSNHSRGLVREEVHKRVGHVAVTYGKYIIIWGGLAKCTTSDNDVYYPSDIVWIYNCTTEVWTCSETKGYAPRSTSCSTGLILDDCLYIFGGIERLTEEFHRYSNSIFRLNLITFHWEPLKTNGIRPLHCNNCVGWVYADKLYFFGGYGQKPTPKEESSSQTKFISEGPGHLKGWNNQLVCFDPSEEEWSWVTTMGKTPYPRAYHAADISGDLAYIFGGKVGDIRNNELYFLNMKTLKWSINLTLSDGCETSPAGLSCHSFTLIEPNQAVIYGGLGIDGTPTEFWWLLKLLPKEQLEWVKKPITKSLVLHKASFSPNTKEVIIVGGVSYDIFNDAFIKNEDYSQQILLQSEPSSLLRECLDKLVIHEESAKLVAEVTGIPKVLGTILEKRISQGHDIKTKICI